MRCLDHFPLINTFVYLVTANLKAKVFFSYQGNVYDHQFYSNRSCSSLLLMFFWKDEKVRDAKKQAKQCSRFLPNVSLLPQR